MRNGNILFAARRFAVVGALAVGIVGAAHAQSDLSTSIIGANDGTISTASTDFGGSSSLDLAGLGNAASLGSIDLSNSGQSGSTGNGGFHGGFTPGATPEPFTMGLSIAGLGIAARRLRNRRSK